MSFRFSRAAPYTGTLLAEGVGVVMEVRTRRIVGRMNDEEGRPVMSEKVVEIHFAGGAPVRAEDPFGVGRARPAGS